MRDTETLLGLVAASLRDGAAHLGRLLVLARTETDANLRAWVRLAAILGAIPILLVSAFFLGLDALVKMVAVLIGARLPAALIVALPFATAALVLVQLGLRRMALSNLEPWRSWRSHERQAELDPRRST